MMVLNEPVGQTPHTAPDTVSFLHSPGHPDASREPTHRNVFESLDHVMAGDNDRQRDR